jgi:hypothetical protein
MFRNWRTRPKIPGERQISSRSNALGEFLGEIESSPGELEYRLKWIADQKKSGLPSGCDQGQQFYLEIGCVLEFVDKDPREFRRYVAEYFWPLFKK